MGTLAAAELDVKPSTPTPGDAATLRARQRFLVVRSFTVSAGPEWKPYSERYPIPAGTTHVSCKASGGPAEIRALGLRADEN